VVFDVDNALTPEEGKDDDNIDLRSYDFGYDFTEYLNGIHNYYAIDWFRQATVEATTIACSVAAAAAEEVNVDEEEEDGVGGDVVMGQEAVSNTSQQSQATQVQVISEPPSTEPKPIIGKAPEEETKAKKALNMDRGASDNAPPSRAGTNLFGGGGKNNKSRKKRKKTKRRKTRRKRKKSIKNRRKKKLRKTKKRKKTKKRRKTKKRGKRKI